MNTLLDVKVRVKSLVGDTDGDFCTDAYLLPLINQAYDQAINYLCGTCSPFITQLQVAPNVALGTSTLAELQKPDEPLFGLVNPLDIEVKQAGQPELNYVMGTRKDILPNTSNYAPNQPLQNWFGKFCWEWRSYILYITPLSFAADIRVRGEFRPPALVKDSDPIAIHPLMTVALAYSTAALIGSERGNAAYIQNYGQQGTNTLDDISAILVRQQQGTSSRVGRINSSRGGRARGQW
jgi:hypothetical protein